MFLRAKRLKNPHFYAILIKETARPGFSEVKMDQRIISARDFCTNNKASLIHAAGKD